MRMVPSEPPRRTSSDAELKVFSLLEATEMTGTTGLHSLRLDRHVRQVEGEADFVIVGPGGVLILEVKGGGVSQRAGGWVYTNRYRKEFHDPDGPFVQARDAMYSLRNELIRALGPEVRQVLFGFAVVTPDAALSVNSVEWGPETVIDRGGIRGLTELSGPLGKSYAGWAARGEGSKRDVSPRLVERIIKQCRPNFEALRPLGAELDAARADRLRATESQFAVLDVWSAVDRLVVEGGAGTGKTIMALELARRVHDSGRSVLVTCHSPVLAGWMRAALPEEVPCTPHRFLRSVRSRSDVVIVDEAQDMMNEAGFDALDRVVVDGLGNGGWALFMDTQNQARVDGAYEPAVRELVVELADTKRPITLRTNVRNTPSIVRSTERLTGTAIGQPHVIDTGLDVEIVIVEPDEVGRRLDEALGHFRREDVAPGSITIITERAREDALDGVRLKYAVEVVALSPGGWPSTRVTIGSPAACKGLENDVIIVLPDVSDSISELYVGMTRAVSHLRILWPSDRDLGDFDAGDDPWRVI